MLLVNYFEILELSFDPPVEDPGKIEAALEDKRKEWSRKATGINGAKYKHYLETIEEIRATMMNAQLRRKLHDDLLNAMLPRLEEDIRLLSLGRVSLYESEVAKLAARERHKLLSLARVRSYVRLPVVPDTASEAKPKRYPMADPFLKGKMASVESNLTLLGFADLYAFINQEGHLSNPVGQDAARLKATATGLKSKYRDHDQYSSAGNLLIAFCEKQFSGEEMRLQYDEYLRYQLVQGVLQRICEATEVDHTLNIQASGEFVNRLTAVLHDRSHAEDMLEDFCKDKGIALERDRKEVALCGYCWATNAADAKVCSHCGQSIVIVCPNCSTNNPSTSSYCKSCSYSLVEIARVPGYCDQAILAMEHLDFQLAEVSLAQAEKFWPSYGRLASLRADMKELQLRMEPELRILRDLTQKKQLHAARLKLQEIRKAYPKFKDDLVEQQMAEGLKVVLELLPKVRAAVKEDDAIEWYLRLAEYCVDDPDALAVLQRYPPNAPQNLTVKTDAAENTVQLRWEAGSTNSRISYLVVRKQDSLPQSPKDGDLIQETAACYLTDASIVAGKVYYYAVYSWRAGVSSLQSQHSEAICNLAEVQNPRGLQLDQKIQVLWDEIAPNARVEVRRALGRIPENSEGTLISSGSKGFLDDGLSNGTTYGYCISLVYTIAGQERRTPGHAMLLTPVPTVQPVRMLSLRRTAPGAYIAEWDADKEDVVLFASEKPSGYAIGETVSLAEIAKQMDQLSGQPISTHSASFTLSSAAFVTAALINGHLAVLGASAYAADQDALQIEHHGDRLFIPLKLPTTASGAVLLYRHDAFPADVGDVSATRKFASYKECQSMGGISINHIEAKVYHISVFAQFRANEETQYSGLSHVTFDNVPKPTILYTIQVHKPFLGPRRAYIILNAQPEVAEFDIPAIVVQAQPQRMPLSVSEGIRIFTIPAGRVRNGHRIELPLTEIKANTFVKPFFQDAQEYRHRKLLTQPDSAHQVI